MASPSPVTITGVALADAADLARNNMSAYWQDPSWVIVWPAGRTLEYTIEQCAMRMPNLLLRNRARLRHQKAVDPATGRLLGYARWLLPESLAAGGDRTSERDEGNGGGDEQVCWAEAQVPDVQSEAEREAIRGRAGAANWVIRDGLGDLDALAVQRKNEILAEKEYLGECNSTLSSSLADQTSIPSLDVPWLTDRVFSRRCGRAVLEYLAVHPENQRKGVATALVRSGVAMAERLRLDIFILAFRMGHGVYSKLGFRTVEEMHEDDSMYGGPGDYGLWLMVKDVVKPEARSCAAVRFRA